MKSDIKCTITSDMETETLQVLYNKEFNTVFLKLMTMNNAITIDLDKKNVKKLIETLSNVVKHL